MRIQRSLAFASLALLTACGDAAVEPQEVGEPQDTLALDSVEATARPELSAGLSVDLAGVGVVAPEVGHGVFAEVLFDNGETRSIILETSLDGRVLELAPIAHIAHDGDLDEDAEGDEVMGQAGSTVIPIPGALAPCKDTSYSLNPYKVVGPLQWYFNAGSTPKDNSKSAVGAKLIAAANNIVTSRNSCKMADQVSATHQYMGTTTAPAQITNTAQCQPAGNGLNTVGFGTLPKGILGLACVYYAGTDVVEADIRFNKSYKWYAKKPTNCSGRYSIEGVATHEFGHVFGLGHVSESKHGNLTMSTSMNGTCQGSEVTLGRGDVLGLRVKY